MNKELAEVITMLRDATRRNSSITFTKKQVKLILKYINDLEKAIAEGVDE